MVVSIIIPIYKVEKYLGECIESILNQTYYNLEILLVDDGSPDHCGEICDQYAMKDKRIKVIHKENQGLGMARNTGLDYATGEFICFVDSDDWLNCNAIETFMRYQEKYNADIVMCNYEKRDDNNQLLYEYRIIDEQRVFDSAEEIEKNIFWPMIGQKSNVVNDFTVNMCVWTNMYRHSIIKENGIRFLSEREYLSEDICFNLQFLLNSRRAVMIPDSLYNYRYNPLSLTNCYKGNEYEKARKLFEKVSMWADQAKVQSEREYRVHRFFVTKVRELMFRLCSSSKSFSEKCLNCKEIEHNEDLESVLDEYPLLSYKIKYFIPAFFMKHKFVKLTVLLFMITGKKR